VVEDLVDDGAGILWRVHPEVGGHIVIVLHELVLVFFLVVVRNLGTAACRESDLGLRWRLATRSNGLLTLALLLGRDVATGTHVAIRLRVGAS
jgi:hypothetical protein